VNKSEIEAEEQKAFALEESGDETAALEFGCALPKQDRWRRSTATPEPC